MKVNKELAIDFIKKNARPLEQAVYQFYFENGSKEDVITELAKFQNPDGGFGNALELDNWNPNSNPIATNDAIITLHRIGALEQMKNIDSKAKNDHGHIEKMVEGILRYLKSHDSFDENQRRWQFAIESTKDYPHAIWWEKDGDGISAFNPTVSLAAFFICYGEDAEVYRTMIKEAFTYMESNEVSGDALKCYILCHQMLSENAITNIADLDAARKLITKKIDEAICKDTSKYGVEYVPIPSDFFADGASEFLNEEVEKRIKVELEILGDLQKEDGGFDISWQWYNEYKEFEQARNWWRPRLTIDKLLFAQRICK